MSNVNLRIWFYANILVFKTPSQKRVLAARLYCLPLICMYVFTGVCDPVQCYSIILATCFFGWREHFFFYIMQCLQFEVKAIRHDG